MCSTVIQSAAWRCNEVVVHVALVACPASDEWQYTYDSEEYLCNLHMYGLASHGMSRWVPAHTTRNRGRHREASLPTSKACHYT